MSMDEHCHREMEGLPAFELIVDGSGRATYDSVQDFREKLGGRFDDIVDIVVAKLLSRRFDEGDSFQVQLNFQVGIESTQARKV